MGQLSRFEDGQGSEQGASQEDRLRIVLKIRVSIRTHAEQKTLRGAPGMKRLREHFERWSTKWQRRSGLGNRSGVIGFTW